MSESNVAPDIAGVIEGWRSWRFTPQGLSSVFHHDLWPHNKEMVASCSVAVAEMQTTVGVVHEPDGSTTYRISRTGKPTHSIPSPNCKCGIYAAKGRNYYAIPLGDIYGKVALWGDVIRGEKACRASHAYPIELYAPDHLIRSPTLTDYGVPIRPWSELPWQLKWHKRLLAIYLCAAALAVLAFIAGAVLAGVYYSPLNVVYPLIGFATVFLLRRIF